MPRFPQFLGPSYTSESFRSGVERTMNFYPEFPQSPGAKSRTALLPTPGYEVFATLDQSPVRGLFSEDGRTFAVVGHKLYEFSADGTPTDRGTVLFDTSPVTMHRSGEGGSELLITAGNHAYIFNLGTNALTDELTGAYQGGYVDGFFLALDRDTSTLQISDLFDGTTWDPGQIAQRQASSDPWVSMLVAGKLIWLFGSVTSEVWYNAGLSPFPFALISGAVLQQGILAPFSAAAVNGLPIWLGQTKDGPAMVYQAGEGFTGRRISTHAVEYALQTYVRNGIDLSGAIGWSYQENGHVFYVLNIAEADATWVFDVTTGQWHERGYWNNSTVSFEASRVQFHCYAFNKHLVGDRESGVIYEQSIDKLSDVGGVEIRRIRRQGYPVRDRRSMVFHRFELYLDAGEGLTSGQGSDPQVMLHVSEDGGKTFWEAPMQGAGAQGDYAKVVEWVALGQALDPVFEVVMTDPIPWRLADAFVDVEVGRH